MTIPEFWTLVSAPAVDVLGWTLLHFIWQGAIVAVLLAGLLWALREYRPRIRYGVSLVALIVLLLLPVVTATLLSNSVGVVSSQTTMVVMPETTAEVTTESQEALTNSEGTAALDRANLVSRWIRPALPWVVFVWGFGVLFFAARWVSGASKVRRLRRNSEPVPDDWRDRLAALADRIGLEMTVALRQSSSVDSPMVSGWWRPIILVPAGLLSGLPPQQVEALLLHELAHIRRHDVLVGQLQAMVETLLFFHPATWWVSGRVRAAREACCDDLAARYGTERTVVARALAALADWAVEGRTVAWAPAAASGSLLNRVRRLLSPEQGPSAPAQRLSMTVAMLVLVGVPMGLAACASQSQQSTPGAEQTAGDDLPAAVDSVEHRERDITVLRTDSTKRTIRFENEEVVTVDSLDDGVYVLRHDGRIDTLDLPDIPPPIEPPLPFDPDSLERDLHARINPDSLERVLRLRIDHDSLDRRALKIRLRADSLRSWHREHGDSLRRRFERIREQTQREMPQRLREQARRLREQAERLEEHAREMERSEPPVGPTSPDPSGG